MRLSTYLAILIGINLVFYLVGYAPIGTQVLNMVFNDNGSINVLKMTSTGDNYAVDTLQPTSESAKSSVIGIFMLGIGASFVVLSFMLGFSALYIIPLLLLFGIVYLFVFPMSFILDPNMPEELIVIITFLYNYLTFMAALTFIRGGS